MAAPGTEVHTLFLLAGGSLLLGYAGHLLFKRYHVSDVVFLLFAGLLAGPVFGLVDPGPLRGAFLFLGPLGLLIVLFEGGLELAWDDLRRHAARAVGMSLLTWALTALAVALVAHYFLGLAPLVALLLGVAVCATGILVVIPLLAQINAPREARVVLTIETSLGDLLSTVATAALASMIVLGASPAMGAQVLAVKFVLGALLGLAAGLAWARVLTLLKGQRFGYPLTVAALLLAYVGTELAGGSGFLMALAFGLVVGNADVLTRTGLVPRLSSLGADMRAHQSEIIFIVKSVYFVYLGLVVSPDVFTVPFLVGGGLLMLAMAAARILSVHLVMGRVSQGLRNPMRILIAGMMPRGLATALIASIPVTMGVPGTEHFLTYTFLIIVGADIATSAGVFAYERARKRATAAAAAAAPQGAGAPGGAPEAW